MEVLGKAISTALVPHEVCITEHAGYQAGVATTHGITPGVTIAIARTATTDLAAWLVVTINRVLDGQPPAPQPAGELIVHGCFNHGGTSVFAWHWAHDGIEVARCVDVDAAGNLAVRLDVLLRTS